MKKPQTVRPTVVRRNSQFTAIQDTLRNQEITTRTEDLDLSIIQCKTPAYDPKLNGKAL